MAERREPSAATAAAEQVRAIVEAAERTAAELVESARAEADRIRSDAAREQATAASLSAGAGRLLERLDELGEAVRGAAAELREELERAGEGKAGPDPELIAEAEAVAAREPDVEEPAPAASEGARVLALKMALDGAPRDETSRYLRENFQLDDPDALLDEVYARAGR